MSPLPKIVFSLFSWRNDEILSSTLHLKEPLGSSMTPSSAWHFRKTTTNPNRDVDTASRLRMGIGYQGSIHTQGTDLVLDNGNLCAVCVSIHFPSTCCTYDSWSPEFFQTKTALWYIILVYLSSDPMLNTKICWLRSALTTA